MATNNESTAAEFPSKEVFTDGDLHDTTDVEPKKVESQDQQALKPQITQEHHDYLMQRHGTTELHPLPSMHDEDPYNWPQWKVYQFYAYILVLSSQYVEKRQSSLGQLPRHDDHFSGCFHHSCV